MIYKIINLNSTDAVVISDKETKILLAKDLSGIVKVIDESKRVYFTTENITTQAIGASYYHTKEEEWYFLLATIAPYKLEGLPMLEVPIINPLCCIAKDGGLTKMNKGCAERNRCIELPNQEEDVEKLALNVYPKDMLETSKGCFDDMNEANRNIWIAGYKAAQKQYSEEDMKNMFILGGKYKVQQPDMFLEKMKEILQSLQKKQFPIAVELTEDLNGFLNKKQ